MSPRILIADDTPPLARMLKRELRHLGDTETADGGTDAYAVMFDTIRRLTEHPPAVVIVDGLEGYGATVADIAIEEGVPVIGYTAEPEVFRRLWRPKLTIIEKTGSGELGELEAAVGRALVKESDHG